MDTRSESNLALVHPDLCKITRRAAEISSQHFVVIQGLRTIAEQKANVDKGASQTMHSRHLPNGQGWACAIDVMALDSANHADWEAEHYQPIAAAMLQAAYELGLFVEWGGDWKTLKDWGHFQLPWLKYP